MKKVTILLLASALLASCTTAVDLKKEKLSVVALADILESLNQKQRYELGDELEKREFAINMAEDDPANNAENSKY